MSGEELTGLVYCKDCRYRRTREAINPFDGIRSWTPDLLAEKQRWDQKLQELAQLEQQRYTNRQDFDFEPQFYDWCAKWTEIHNKRIIDPVRGTTHTVYALCAYENAEATCSKYMRR